MTNTLQFGNKSWQEDVVDTERSHFLLTYVPSDNSSSIIAALVGCWNDEKRYFPFQLVTDDPEAIAHAVDVTNRAFNTFLDLTPNVTKPFNIEMLIICLIPIGIFKSYRFAGIAFLIVF